MAGMTRPDNPTLQGKTVLITGGARGIGREAATQLAALGARVVVVARDEKKAQEELAHMRKTGGAFDLLVADLASLESVRRATAEYRSRFGALDVLINNAAVNVHSRQTTQDGLELHFGVNYLSHYLLTRLLIDLLALAAPSRIVTTGAMQFGAVIDFNDLQLERGWGNTKSITRAKMGLFLFSREGADRKRRRPRDGEDGVSRASVLGSARGAQALWDRAGGGRSDDHLPGFVPGGRGSQRRPVCQVQAGALERPGARRSGGEAPLGRERAARGANAVKMARSRFWQSARGRLFAAAWPDHGRFIA